MPTNQKIKSDFDFFDGYKLIIEEKRLTEELTRLKYDDDYIKKIARERFHMVKQGEKVFRVVDRRKVNKQLTK